jgi:hypothetical protein
MPHPDEGLIHAWLEGERDAAEAARVEALIARDPQWAAAAAEARGLIAASSRIAGTLDGLSAKVNPRAKTRSWLGYPWLSAVAALLLVVAGATTVLRRKLPELGQPTRTVSGAAVVKAPSAPSPSSAPAAPAAPQSAAVVAQGAARDKKAAGVLRKEPSRPAEVASSDLAKRLDEPKGAASLKDRDLAERDPRRANTTSLQGAATGAAGRVAAEARAPSQLGVRAPASPVDSLSAKREKERAAELQASVARRAADKVETFKPLSCFKVIQPTDAVPRVFTLSATALADSVRLAGFVIRGDTLLSVARGFVAVATRCPDR